MLQAMGLSRSRANGVPNNEAPSQIVRQHHSGLPDVTPPSPASITQASQSLRATANKTAAQKTVQKEQAAIATVTDPTAKAYLEAKLRYFQWQQGLVSGPAPPNPPVPNTPASIAALAKYNHAKAAFTSARTAAQAAQTAATATTQQARAHYASYIAGVNRQDQQAVAAYNQQLMTQLQQYAPTYDSAMAQQNLQTAMQATKPTQLLQFNVQQAYQAQKQTYTPLSAQLPSGQSSGKS